MGLGVILIFAHNWDNLSINSKTGLAFLPLLLALCCVGYTLRSKNESRVWKEVSGILLYFSIAAAIALVAQIYHISGSEDGFIRSWLLLGLPIIYLLPSSVVSVLILMGLMGLSNSAGAGWHSTKGPLLPYDQILIFLLVLPYYINLCRTKSKNNFTLLHHWIVSVVFCAITIPKLIINGNLGLLSILVLFGLLLGIGKTDYFKDQKLRWNPYLLIGVLGSCITLYSCTFISYWKRNQGDSTFVLKYDYIIILFFIAAIYLLYLAFKNISLKNLNPVHYSFLLFIPIYFIGQQSNMTAMVLSNILLGLVGLHYIIYGNRIQRLALLNFGMIIVSGIILTRFFEIDLSFIARGLCFVLIGLAFFAANFFLIRKSESK